jgi:hypothetical protein
MRAVGLTRGYTCDLRVTQSVLGDVDRSPMELRGRGLIALEKQVLTILRWDELQAEGGFDPLYLRLEKAAEAA